MLEIEKAEYVGGYKLYLTFNNGRAGVANREAIICADRKPIFAKLRDKTTFKYFKVEHCTVV